MKRKLNWLMCSALAISGVTFVTAQAADDANKPATPTVQAADQNLGQPGTLANDAQRAAADQAGSAITLPQGAKAMDKKVDAPARAKVIANAAEAALNKGDFDNLVNKLVDQDRDRLGDWKSFDFKTLDGRIEQVKKAFKDKYGEDFSIDKDKVFGDAQAVEGEIEDPAQFVQHWPVPPIAGMDAVTAGANLKAGDASVKVGDSSVTVKAGDDATKANATVDKDTKNNGNIEKGRNVCIVRLPAQGDIPAMNVSEISELTGWKIDIPNDRGLQQIHDDLLKHLTMVGDNTANWPADKEGAKGYIARHVIMALYGIDMPQKKS